MTLDEPRNLSHNSGQGQLISPREPAAEAGQPSLARRTRLDGLLDLSAALVWALFAAVNLSAILKGGDVLNIGRLVFYTLVTYFFLRRRPAMRKGSWWENALAWGGAIFPMLGLAAAPGGWPVLGLVVQALALVTLIVAILSLGRSFGIAPADRGLVISGMYRYVRHPLYAAELWFIAGYLIANPSYRNLVVLLIMIGVQVVRALREERVISGYAHYAADVRWRLLPLVW